MIQRVVSGSLAVLTLLGLTSLDGFLAERAAGFDFLPQLFGQGNFIPVVIAFVVLLAFGEIVEMMRSVGLRPCVPLALVGCMALVLSPWLTAGEVIGLSMVDMAVGLKWQIVWLVGFSLVGTMAHMRRGPQPTAIADCASTVFLLVYLGLLPSFAVQLRCDYAHGDPLFGAWALTTALLITAFADIGALFVGRAVGRTQLAPVVSPGKTVEGFFGGVLGSVGLALALYYAGTAALAAQLASEAGGPLPTVGVGMLAFTWERFCAFVYDSTANATLALTQLSVAQVGIFGFVMAVAGQVGDLFESLCKRSANIKDSGTLIPGMGGVLDRIDSALFAIPLAWFLLTQVWAT